MLDNDTQVVPSATNASEWTAFNKETGQSFDVPKEFITAMRVAQLRDRVITAIDRIMGRDAASLMDGRTVKNLNRLAPFALKCGLYGHIQYAKITCFWAHGGPLTRDNHSERHVYVMQGNGQVKIGVAVDVHKRVRSVAHAAGGACLVWHSQKTEKCFEIESIAHGKLKAYRTRGEWFKCDSDTAVAAVLAAAEYAGVRFHA